MEPYGRSARPAGETSGVEMMRTKALRDAVRGSVLLPGDAGYDQERTGFQRGDRHGPDVLVAARTPEDVRAAVDHARRQGMPLAVQATGHGLRAAARGGVLVATRGMTGIRIDAAARTAWVEAGVRAGDLVAEAARHGLAPVNGSAPGVGVVGYALGGGVGLLGREFGYATGLVRRLDVVTADGRLRRVTAESCPDLFWGLRGGGGGLGAVTGLELGLVPVERIFGGRLVFDGGQVAEEVLRTWQEWTRSVPDTLTSAVTLLPMPDLPAVPAALRGRYLAQVHLAFTGPREEGERWVRPLRKIGALLVDEVREMPYTECATVFSEPETPHAYRSSNVLLDAAGLDDDARRAVPAEAGPSAAAMCVLCVRHLGGAFSRPPEVPDAVDHRDARYLVYVLSPVSGPDQDDAVRSLHARVLAPVTGPAPARNGNFLHGPQEPATLRSVHRDETAARLERLRAEFDPQGLFRGIGRFAGPG